MDQYLRDLYYNSDLAYSGITKLWRKIKADKKQKKVDSVKYKELKQWLEQQEVYTMHKPAIKKFPYRKVIVSGIDDQWQADIVEMSNDQGYRYILTVIDVLSKYAWAIPLKSKRGIEMADTFELIFKDHKVHGPIKKHQLSSVLTGHLNHVCINILLINRLDNGLTY